VSEEQKTTTWWKVSEWSDEPSFASIEVLKATNNWLVHLPLRRGKPQREKKLTEFHRWFPTKTQALEDRIALIEREREGHEQAAQDAKRRAHKYRLALLALDPEDRP
jgi:hypothetical protein